MKRLWITLLLFVCVYSVAYGQAIDRTHVNYVNPLQYGATCDATTLNAAITAIGSSKRTLILTATDRAKVACTWTLASNVTTNVNTTVYISEGVNVSQAVSTTFTFNGPVQVDDVESFQGLGTYTFNYPQGTTITDFVSSGCLPTVPTPPSVVFPTFACEGNILVGGKVFNIQQLTSTVSLIGATNTTYWVALDYSKTRTVASWTREAGTKYIWLASATRPTTPAGTTILFSSQVTGCPGACNISVITDVRTPKSYVSSGVYSVTDKLYGAVGDGVADDSAAITLTLANAAGKKVIFPPGTYKMVSGVTILGNNVSVDFGSATFVNAGPTYLFTFGPTSDTPVYTNLSLQGGYWTQSDPATGINRNYIHIRSYKGFTVRDMYMKNVSNGGITVWAGSEDGLIDGITIDGNTAYTVKRGIWFDGSSASDYASQLVDISTITRNGTPVPVYAVKRVTVKGSVIIGGDLYGIYLSNTRDIKIEGNYIDISGSGLRCIAINAYSPQAIVRGNTCKGDQAATGILITQFSHDVLIADNLFLGTFGGGRDIFVQYLAEALITGNQHKTDSTQVIQVDTGGIAVIRGNTYTRSAYSANTRVVLFGTVDPAVAGTSTYGDTATILPGLVFTDNVIKVRNAGVVVATPTSAAGRVAGLDVITVARNIFYNYDTAAGSDDYPLRIAANGTTYKVAYSMKDNLVYPGDYAIRNIPSVAGTGYTELHSPMSMAAWDVDVATAGGAITVTKLYGDNFTLDVTRSAAILILSPRSANSAVGGAAALPVGIVDTLQTMYSYDLVKTTNNNWAFTPRDSAGVAINTATTAAAFRVFAVANKD